jgi:hypothetical protein
MARTQTTLYADEGYNALFVYYDFELRFFLTLHCILCITDSM